jgi:hypothetical protein
MQCSGRHLGVGESASVSSHHDRWRGIWATRGLADVLGASVVAGRIPDRIDPKGPRPMLIAQRRWQADFVAEAGVIGRVVEFADNKRFIVVGVLSSGNGSSEFGSRRCAV